MEAVFLSLLNMSISASWLVAAVLILRLFMRRVPRGIYCLLWAMVGLRLVWPFTFESILSLIPSTETIPIEMIHAHSSTGTGSVHAISPVSAVVLNETTASAISKSTDLVQALTRSAGWIWLAGIVIMTLHTVISTACIYRKVDEAVKLEKGVWLCDWIDTPFILGIVRPQIYLPSDLAAEDSAYVLAHERAHLKRRDHWWKPLGFALLAVHWFNPVMWLAYALLCGDIEMACDERVIGELGVGSKKAYSTALIRCSVSRRMLTACPLAFGEVGVKQRVKAVLRYKKPAFWAVQAAALVCVIVAACFLTDPLPEDPMDYHTAASRLRAQENISAIYYPVSENGDESLIRMGMVEAPALADFLDGTSWRACDVPAEHSSLDHMVSPGSVSFAVDDGYTLTLYRRQGLTPYTYGTVAHNGEIQYYRVGWNDYQKAAALVQVPELTETSLWFDYSDSYWPQEVGQQNIMDPEGIKGAILRCDSENMMLITDTETLTLFQGWPIWNAYFADLNGDGIREVCATVSMGFGMIDTRVMVYDFVSGLGYELQERGTYDYALSMHNGELMVTQSSHATGHPMTSGRLILAQDNSGNLKLQVLDSLPVTYTYGEDWWLSADPFLLPSEMLSGII